jgi:hypothetical protein
MEDSKKKKSLSETLKGLIVAVLMFAVQAWLLRWCWNLDVTEVLGLRPISVAQAMGLMIVGRMIFSRGPALD